MDLHLRTRPTVASREAATVIEVAGELDLHSAPQLRAEIGRALEAGAPRLIVDLSGVTFLDSTGVGVLVGALKRAHQATGTLLFCGAQPRVRRVFEITGILGALPLFETRAQALDALPAEQERATPATASRLGGAMISAGEPQ